MFDYEQPQRRDNFDAAFPLRTKFIPRSEMDGAQEAQDQYTGNISGEVELIARTSYRLGHAENANAANITKAYRLERELQEAREEIENLKRNERYNEDRIERGTAQNRELHQLLETANATNAKLKAKLNPKKKAPAKKAKK